MGRKTIVLNMTSLGKFFIGFGIILIILGAVLLALKHVPFIGKLPGDIYVQKKNFTFYFPLTTCILLSVLLSIILYFLSRR